MSIQWLSRHPRWVVDFLDVHWRGLHWPAFNLADVFVVGAVIGWGLWSLKRQAPAATLPEVRS